MLKYEKILNENPGICKSEFCNKISDFSKARQPILNFKGKNPHTESSWKTLKKLINTGKIRVIPFKNKYKLYLPEQIEESKDGNNKHN